MMESGGLVSGINNIRFEIRWVRGGRGGGWGRRTRSGTGGEEEKEEEEEEGKRRRRKGGGGCTHVMRGSRRMTVDPRIPMYTVPGRSTSGFRRPDRLLLASSAKRNVRSRTSRLKDELHPRRERGQEEEGGGVEEGRGGEEGGEGGVSCHPLGAVLVLLVVVVVALCPWLWR